MSSLNSKHAGMCWRDIWTSSLLICAFAAGALAAPPQVSVVAASATYPAGTEQGGLISMTDDPLGPFSGQSVTFRGLDVGGVQQVYRYRLDYNQIVTLDSVVIEGAAWAGDTISLFDEQGMEIADIVALSHNGSNFFFNQLFRNN